MENLNYLILAWIFIDGIRNLVVYKSTNLATNKYRGVGEILFSLAFLLWNFKNSFPVPQIVTVFLSFTLFIFSLIQIDKSGNKRSEAFRENFMDAFFCKENHHCFCHFRFLVRYDVLLQYFLREWCPKGTHRR